MQSCLGQNRRVVDLCFSSIIGKGKAGWSNVQEDAAWITLCILGANGLYWLWSFAKLACTIIRERCYQFSSEDMLLFPVAGALPRSMPTLTRIPTSITSATVMLSDFSLLPCPIWIHSLVCRIGSLYSRMKQNVFLVTRSYWVMQSQSLAWSKERSILSEMGFNTWNPFFSPIKLILTWIPSGRHAFLLVWYEAKQGLFWCEKRTVAFGQIGQTLGEQKCLWNFTLWFIGQNQELEATGPMAPSQEVDRDECWCSSGSHFSILSWAPGHRLVLSVVGAGLCNSVNPF